MKSGTQRIFYGDYVQGPGKTSAMSQKSDYESGGADFVFLRSIAENESEHGYGTRVYVDAVEIVRRLDVFSYERDYYGVKNKNNLNYPTNIFSSGSTTFDTGVPYQLKEGSGIENSEIMARHTIPPSAILGYNFASAVSRKDALDRLKKAGVTEVNGIPIEEFVLSEGISTVVNTVKGNKNKNL
jgi:hypothetical protein